MKPAAKWTLIAGAFCTLGAPMLGFIITVLSMIGAFNALGHKDISGPAILSGHIGQALVATEIGLVISLALGLPLMVTAVVLLATTKPTPSPKATPNP